MRHYDDPSARNPPKVRHYYRLATSAQVREVRIAVRNPGSHSKSASGGGEFAMSAAARRLSVSISLMEDFGHFQGFRCRSHLTLIAFVRSQTSPGGFHYGSRHYCVDHHWSYRWLDHRKADEGRWLRCADGHHRRHSRCTHRRIRRRAYWLWRRSRVHYDHHYCRYRRGRSDIDPSAHHGKPIKQSLAAVRPVAT